MNMMIDVSVEYSNVLGGLSRTSTALGTLAWIFPTFAFNSSTL